MDEEDLTLLDSIIEELNSNNTENSNSTEEGPELIESNKKDLSVPDNLARFSSAVWFDKVKKKDILIGGAGGICSWAALLLSRLNPNKIIMFDPDKIESVNYAGQLFEYGQLGQYKVDAVWRLLSRFSDYNKGCFFRRSFNKESYHENIMICGFDNMKARRVFFESWKKGVANSEDKKDHLFIDGRLAAETFQILCIRGDDDYNINRYETEFLFSDEEADQDICSYKQTSFCAAMIASYMTNLFINFCANQTDLEYPRDLPFYTDYSADTMFFKTEA